MWPMIGALTTLQRAEAAERAMSEDLDRVVVKSVLFTSGEQHPTKPAPRSPDQGKIILACLPHDHRPNEVPVAGRR